MIDDAAGVSEPVRYRRPQERTVFGKLLVSKCNGHISRFPICPGSCCNVQPPTYGCAVVVIQYPPFLQHCNGYDQQRHEKVCTQGARGCDSRLFIWNDGSVEVEESRSKVDHRPFAGIRFDLEPLRTPAANAKPTA